MAGRQRVLEDGSAREVPGVAARWSGVDPGGEFGLDVWALESVETVEVLPGRVAEHDPPGHVMEA